MEKVTTAGIDLAKDVFSLHGVDAMGRVVLRRSVRRNQLEEVVAKLPTCLIGMEACSGAHEWARRFARYGHTVKLIGATALLVVHRVRQGYITERTATINRLRGRIRGGAGAAFQDGSPPGAGGQ